MPHREGSEPEGTPIGQIPLKKMAVKADSRPVSTGNPMNRLVPYLDLFRRLSDTELARLAGVSEEVAAQLRAQVVAVCTALDRYADLLPRLADPELMRLTGASAKTVRFWRLCQSRNDSAVPRVTVEAPTQPISTGAAGRPQGSQAAAREQGTDEYPASDSGAYSVRNETGPQAPARASDSGSHARSAGESSATRAMRAKSAGESSGVRQVPRAKGAGESSGVRQIPRAKGAGESSGVRPIPRAKGAGESSGVRSVPRVSSSESSGVRQPPNPTPAQGRRAASSAATGLGVSGAPFPGYDFDPEEARKLDQNQEGIVIGLDLPEPDEDVDFSDF